MRSLAALASLVVLSCLGASEQTMGTREVQIFYYPFHLETLHPITIDDIELKAPCRFSLPAEGAEVAALRRLFAKAERGTFDNRVVRLKIVGLAGGDVFADKDGGLLLGHGRKEAQLGEVAFDQLKELIESAGTAHGCAAW
jgi:hypothetical protein